MKKQHAFLLICALAFFQCQNEPKPAANAPVNPPALQQDKTEAELPLIKAIAKDGTIQYDNGSTQPIPHYGEQGYMVLFLVRHCELDASIKDNPPLTAEGRARAERLGRVVDNAVLDKIASTNTKGVLETVQAVRRWAGDPVMENFPFEAQNDWLVENLEQGSGKRIFYVGHRNSVPIMLNNLTASVRYKNIPELDYGRFYVVVTQGVGKTEVIEAKY